MDPFYPFYPPPSPPPSSSLLPPSIASVCAGTWAVMGVDASMVGDALISSSHTRSWSSIR